MSTQELLAQKAEEQNMHASAIQTPPWGASQSWCSQPEGTHKPWSDPNYSPQPPYHADFQSETQQLLSGPESWNGGHPSSHYANRFQGDSNNFDGRPPPMAPNEYDYSQQEEHGQQPMSAQPFQRGFPQQEWHGHGMYEGEYRPEVPYNGQPPYGSEYAEYGESQSFGAGQAGGGPFQYHDGNETEFF